MLPRPVESGLDDVGQSLHPNWMTSPRIGPSRIRLGERQAESGRRPSTLRRYRALLSQTRADDRRCRVKLGRDRRTSVPREWRPNLVSNSGQPFCSTQTLGEACAVIPANCGSSSDALDTRFGPIFLRRRLCKNPVRRRHDVPYPSNARKPRNYYVASARKHSRVLVVPLPRVAQHGG